MPKAYSDEVRWIVLYKRLVLEHSAARVSRDLEGLRAGAGSSGLAAETQDRWVARFLATGFVSSVQGKRAAPPANRQMGPEEVAWLFEQILNCPARNFREHATHFQVQFGRRIHKATLCRAARYLLLMRRQRVQHVRPATT